MGSWYGTCGITNLPLVNEEIVMVPLEVAASGRSGADHVEPHDIWCPTGIPLYGEYDDYGMIKIDANQQRMHEMNLVVIASELVERPYISDQTPEITIESLKDMAVYQTAIHENRLDISQRDWSADTPTMIETPISRMFVLRTVWDELVKNGPPVRFCGVDGKDNRYDKEYYREGLLGVFNENATSESYEKALDRIYTNAYSIRGAVFDIKRHCQLTGKLRDAIIGQTADQLAELYVIMDMMSLLRKTWMPQSGAGHQNHDLHAYEVLLKATKMSIGKTKAWRREHWDMEFDDE